MIKKVLLLFFAIAIGRVASAQQCDSINLGTKTLYTAISQKHTSVPIGYQPVFINHVARHGSRHLTKDVAVTTGYQLLAKADSLALLTTEGLQLFQILVKLNNAEHQYVKSISFIGKQEQNGLAKRMAARNAVFFTRGAVNCNVQITKEVRTRQTADAFLAALNKKANITTDGAYKVNDTTLRFYDLSPAYLQFEEKGSWQQTFESWRGKWFTKSMTEAFLSRFFDKAFFKNVNERQKEDFTGDIYGFYTILPSIESEVDKAGIKIRADSIRQFFNCKELLALSKLDALEDYLLKGPGVNNSGIQVKIAAPLLVDFIKTTDDFIKNASYNLQLRFSHAETIAPFAALLGLEGADKAVKNVMTYTDQTWNPAGVVPLSANIQWILYKNDKTEDYLIKFLLNEKEVKVSGLKTNRFPYYSWNAVRSLYVSKLQQFHLNLTDDLYGYLKKVQ